MRYVGRKLGEVKEVHDGGMMRRRLQYQGRINTRQCVRIVLRRI